MSEHLPEELHYLLKHENLSVCVGGTHLNVVVKEHNNGEFVTIGIGSNQTIIDPASEYHSEWIYITFKNGLWFQLTVFDNEGHDYIDGGDFNHHTDEEIRQITCDTVKQLTRDLIIPEIN